VEKGRIKKERKKEIHPRNVSCGSEIRENVQKYDKAILEIQDL